jgi:hypothetical protein
MKNLQFTKTQAQASVSTSYARISDLSSAPNASQKRNFRLSSILNRKKLPDMRSVPKNGTKEAQLLAKTPEHLTETLNAEQMENLKGKNSIVLEKINHYITLSTKEKLTTAEKEKKHALMHEIYPAILKSIKNSKIDADDAQLDEDMFFLARASGFKGQQIKNIAEIVPAENSYIKYIVDLVASLNTPAKLETALHERRNLSLLLLKQRQSAFAGLLRSVSNHNGRLNEGSKRLLDNVQFLHMPRTQNVAVAAGIAAAAAIGAIVGYVTHDAMQNNMVGNYISDPNHVTAGSATGNVYNGESWHYGAIVHNPEYEKLVPSYHDPVTGKDFVRENVLNDKNAAAYKDYWQNWYNFKGNYIEIDPKTGKPIVGGTVLKPEDVPVSKRGDPINLKFNRLDTTDGTHYDAYPKKNEFNVAGQEINVKSLGYEPVKGGKRIPTYIDQHGKNIPNEYRQIIDNKTHKVLIEGEDLNKIETKSGWAAFGVASGVALIPGSIAGTQLALKIKSLARYSLLNGDKNIQLKYSISNSAAEITPRYIDDGNDNADVEQYATSTPKKPMAQKLSSSTSVAPNVKKTIELDENGDVVS